MRVAHFSDLHLLSHGGASFLQFANKRWIGALSLITSRSRHYHVEAFEDMVADINAQGIDHVICTGDVTNLAFAQEFDFARERFDRLQLGPTNVTVVPGNHDAYVAEGHVNFADRFADYSTADADWRWTDADAEPMDRDDDLRWPLVRVRGELAMIGLSSSRTTPWFTAFGRLGPGQLKRLGQALSDRRLVGKVRLVAIHHPPAGSRGHSKVRGLHDHAGFAAVLAEHGADLVVHGHEHVDLRETLPGPAGSTIEILGVPSGTYEHNKPARTGRYRIVEIEHGRITRQHLRVWQRGGRTFTADTAAQQPVVATF